MSQKFRLLFSGIMLFTLYFTAQSHVSAQGITEKHYHKFYEAGHMMYVHKQSLVDMKKNVGAFYDSFQSK